MLKNPLVKFWLEKVEIADLAISQGLRATPFLRLVPPLETALNTFADAHGYSVLDDFQLDSDEQKRFLLNCARNFAVLSMRKGDARAIRHGLLTLIVEDGKLDIRETLLALAFLNHSAMKLGLSLDEIFSGVMQCCSRQLFDIITGFLGRPVQKKALAAFGYKEVTRSGGFDFKCEW